MKKDTPLLEWACRQHSKISVRLFNVLVIAQKKYPTVNDIKKADTKTLLEINGCGIKTVKELYKIIGIQNTTDVETR